MTSTMVMMMGVVVVDSWINGYCAFTTCISSYSAYDSSRVVTFIVDEKTEP